MLEIIELFQKKFGGRPSRIVQAPGRLELLGNHTDYNEGLVMSLAVDRHIYMASSPRQDGHVELVSSAFGERENFPIDVLEKNPAAPWANYVKGVLFQLRRYGVHFTGFNAAIHGTIPIGAGMSSSAALEVAAALTVRQLHPFTVTDTGITTPPRRDSKDELPPLKSAEKMVLARLCQAAENQFVGVQCGLLDQLSSLFGKASQVIEIDCYHHSVEHSPMPGGTVAVVCDSGVKHDLSAGDYNELRRHCESAARSLGVRSLRFVDPQILAANQNKLSERDYQCAYHIVGENQRVVFGERALRADDIEQFGQYLYQSHESSRDSFKNSTPELDFLVELAQTHPSCYGARLTGGGFGGATINLVRHHEAKCFMGSMALQYEKRTGRRMQPMLCQIVDGAK
ncbi:MAG: galactokinase family protein [Verrucomicrobiota bacterium]